MNLSNATLLVNQTLDTNHWVWSLQTIIVSLTCGLITLATILGQWSSATVLNNNFFSFQAMVQYYFQLNFVYIHDPIRIISLSVYVWQIFSLDYSSCHRWHYIHFNYNGHFTIVFVICGCQLISLVQQHPFLHLPPWRLIAIMHLQVCICFRTFFLVE